MSISLLKEDMNTEKALIIITGTDSGIDRYLCKIFIQQKYYVLATYLEKPGTAHPFTPGQTPGCDFYKDV